MPTIRPFEERDAAAVSRVMFESFRTFLGDRMGDRPAPPDYWIRNAVRTGENLVGAAFVAEEAGQVIGFISVTANTRFGFGTLAEIGVDPAVFAKGTGRALFEAAEAFWKSHHLRKVTTCTSHINTRAQAYYARMGFHEEGRLKDHFFPGIDEIQLAKFYQNP